MELTRLVAAVMWRGVLPSVSGVSRLTEWERRSWPHCSLPLTKAQWRGEKLLMLGSTTELVSACNNSSWNDKNESSVRAV